MKKGIIATLWLLTLLAALAGGVLGGVYYHTEISVLYRGITQQYTPPADPQIAGDNIGETTSVVELPGLEAPLPLVYSDTLEEHQIQEYLKEGAVVLPLGTAFGDPGNVVVTAHSSGTEAFGPYRFAFAKLSKLEVGDEYTIKTPTATYLYRAYAKEVVWPHEVDKLPADNRSTVTLVTCWPLWTNFQRLLVHTELVSVDYSI